MISGYRIEGFAIVSVEGMISDAVGHMPKTIKNDVDQRFFSDGLDRAAVVVHGRNSHEHQPHSPRRKRLILTRQVAVLAPGPDNGTALLWNTAGAPLDAACRALGASDGMVAIIGGTDVFGLFLELGYDAFHLSRAARAHLPGGRPVFPGVPARTPEELLAERGLKPGPERVLDAEAGVTLVTWERAS